MTRTRCRAPTYSSMLGGRSMPWRRSAILFLTSSLPQPATALTAPVSLPLLAQQLFEVHPLSQVILRMRLMMTTQENRLVLAQPHVGRGVRGPTWDVGSEVPRGTWGPRSHVGRGVRGPTWDVGSEVPRGTWGPTFVCLNKGRTYSRSDE